MAVSFACSLWQRKVIQPEKKGVCVCIWVSLTSPNSPYLNQEIQSLRFCYIAKNKDRSTAPKSSISTLQGYLESLATGYCQSPFPHSYPPLLSYIHTLSPSCAPSRSVPVLHTMLLLLPLSPPHSLSPFLIDMSEKGWKKHRPKVYSPKFPSSVWAGLSLTDKPPAAWTPSFCCYWVLGLQVKHELTSSQVDQVTQPRPCNNLRCIHCRAYLGNVLEYHHKPLNMEITSAFIKVLLNSYFWVRSCWFIWYNISCDSSSGCKEYITALIPVFRVIALIVCCGDVY